MGKGGMGMKKKKKTTFLGVRKWGNGNEEENVKLGMVR